MSNVLLRIDDLKYAYDDRVAVKGVSFDLYPGEVFGLLGPNGAGKTTTISCISGHLKQYTGQMTLTGNPYSPHQKGEHRRLMGLVPQEIAIYETLTAAENLALFAKLCGVPGDQIKSTVDGMLAFAGLTERKNDLVNKFSGGMKRRLNLVCGIVHSPPLVLMDEPTVGVDPQSRNHLFDSIIKMREQNTAILYTTHYMEEAERLCDRIAIMNEGAIIAIGTAQELKQLANAPNGTLENAFLQLTGRSLRDES
ncbi:MAG: ABC transporter ATP-binding protein [Pirellula sp.]